MKKKKSITSNPISQRDEAAARELAATIRATRLELGMSQSKFAARLGVKQSTIFRWETDRSRPHPTYLKELAVIAPPKRRPIFESAAQTNLAQIQMDRASVSTYEVDNDSSEEDLLSAGINVYNELFLRAKSGDRKARNKLLDVTRVLVKQV